MLASARWVSRILRAYASLYTSFVAHTNRTGFEDGLNFWGQAAAFDPDGEQLVEGPAFEEALTLVELDLNQLHRTRARLPVLRDERTALVQREMNRILSDRNRAHREVVHDWPRFAYQYRPDRVSWSGFYKAEITRTGFSRAVINLSGGIDSALSCVLAAEALGAQNVLAIRLPYKTSSPDSLAHAQMVIDAIGVQSLTLEITPMVDPLIAAFPEMSKVRKGNIMARQRMIVLYDQSVALQRAGGRDGQQD